MKYLRIYADENGESHVEEMSVEFDMVRYAPPAPAIGVSNPTDATRYIMVHFPADWIGEFHPTPRRQLFILMSGRLQGQTSDGSLADLKVGDALLMEDTTGKGHSAKTMNGQPAHGVMIHLE
jgi:hypothetical protein